MTLATRKCFVFLEITSDHRAENAGEGHQGSLIVSLQLASVKLRGFSQASAIKRAVRLFRIGYPGESPAYFDDGYPEGCTVGGAFSCPTGFFGTSKEFPRTPSLLDCLFARRVLRLLSAFCMRRRSMISRQCGFC